MRKGANKSQKLAVDYAEGIAVFLKGIRSCRLKNDYTPYNIQI